MPRRPNIMRPVPLRTTFPEDVRAQLDLHLYSEVEGRVPQGAYQAFLIERIREFFNRKSYDTGKGVVYGSPEAIAYVATCVER